MFKIFYLNFSMRFFKTFHINWITFQKLSPLSPLIAFVWTILNISSFNMIVPIQWVYQKRTIFLIHFKLLVPAWSRSSTHKTKYSSKTWLSYNTSQCPHSIAYCSQYIHPWLLCFVATVVARNKIYETNVYLDESLNEILQLKSEIQQHEG